MKKRKLKCKRCGYEWTSRHNPQTCPSCRNKYWNIKPIKLKCNKCGYIWNQTRKDNKKLVQACANPKCRSREWDK